MHWKVELQVAMETELWAEFSVYECFNENIFLAIIDGSVHQKRSALS